MSKVPVRLSAMLDRIKAYNNAPGVGFDPRMIVVDMDTFKSLEQEIADLRDTIVDPSSGRMRISGIPVVLDSQVLKVKP